MKIGTWAKTIAPTLALVAVMGMVGTAQAHKKKTTNQTTTSSSMSKKSTTKKSAMKGHLTGYKSEAEAKAACGMGGVAWHATGSKAFHVAGSKYFGKTKHGAYVCEKAAMSDGLHKAKN
ncbi:MAG: hypothetical protein ACP5M1_04035 [Acidiphilium sp.]